LWKLTTNHTINLLKNFIITFLISHMKKKHYEADTTTGV